MATFYVDCSLQTDSHAGTQDDPFSQADFIATAEAATEENVYYIKGPMVLDTVIRWDGGVGRQEYRSWDPATNGPCRIHSLIDPDLSHPSEWYGIIWRAEGSLSTGNCKFYNCYVSAPSFSNAAHESYGSVFIADSDGTYSFAGFPAWDTIIIAHKMTGGGAALDRCALVFDESDANGMSYTRTVTTWVPRTAFPAWNAPKESFNTALLFVGLGVPVQPGTLPYTGYETFLWGEQRTGVGTGSYIPIVVTPTKKLQTPLDLIKGAFDLINITGDGLEPSTEMTSKAFVMLNDIVKIWNIEKLMLYKEELVVGTMTGNVNPTTIGPTGAAITASRPVRIERAYTRYPGGSNPVDFQMEQIDHNRYQEIIVKSAGTSYPTHFYYQPDFPNGKIFTYPVQSRDIEIHISCWMQLEEFTSITQEINLPFGYDTALKYQLACDISPTYGKPLMRGDNVFDRAADLRSKIKRANQPDNNVQLDAALMSNTNRGYRFNILRGF